MGLFNRKKKKEKTDEYVVTEERIQEILTDGVEVGLGMGIHGNDEVVAGAMMGSATKLLAMSNYGKIKYKLTTLYFLDDSIFFQSTGLRIPYNELYRWEKKKVGTLHTEFILVTSHGEINLKCFHQNFLAIIEILPSKVQEYLDQLNQEQEESVNIEEQSKAESDMDRLIRLGELHERGLLSDEEFAEAKKKLL